MKSPTAHALLLALLVAAPLVPALGAPPRAAVTARVEEDRFKEFEQKFRQAMKINAKEEMAKLLDRYSWESVLVIISTCEAISNQSSEHLEEFAAALNEAWKRQYDGSRFVDHVYEYFSLLDPVIKRNRLKLKNLFLSTRDQFNENKDGAKDSQKFAIHASEFERLAKGFEEFEDWYHASESWISYATCYDQGFREKKDVDLYKATEAYKKALDARDKIELHDKRYREILPIFQRYEKQGYYKDPEAPEGAPTKSGPIQESADSALTVDLRFERIDEVEAFERPNYHADAIFPAWTALALQGPGSRGTIPGVEGCPSFVRVGIADVRVDVAGDGPENDEKIKLSGNVEPVEFELGSGEEQRRYAVLSTIGGQNDNYQGVQANLAPSDQYCTLYLLAAGSMVGDVDGIPVRVIDDNMDGVYGSPPVQWGHLGVIEGDFQHDMDSIVVGASKRAIPWSEHANLDGRWFKLESRNKGTQLVATPIEVQSGTLKVKFKGLSPDWVVVRGTGKLDKTYFDLMQNGAKGVEVPVGVYELFMGRVSKGKKLQVMKALVLPGPQTPSWEVNPGETTTIELGAPFGFEFQYDADAERLSVTGTSLAVTGSANERYERFWNCVPRPEVSFRAEGTKRGSKGEDMGYVQSPQSLTDLGFRASWFPLDVTLDRSKTEGQLEVQLVEKKNKLFGKIESEWN